MADLRQRTAATLRESEALCESGRWACAQSSATCEAVRISRLQWRTWRAGLEVLQRRAAALGTPQVLRVCSGCASVCFAPDSAPHSAGDASAAETWVLPPRSVRVNLDTSFARLVLVVAECPRCRSIAVERDAGDAIDAATSTSAWPHDAANVLLSILADVSATAARLVERDPSLDEQAALDLAFADAVDRLARTVTPDELREIAEALRAVASELRDVPRPRAESPSRPPGDGAGSIRFRPPLRSR
jgi:hypothetical protein